MDELNLSSSDREVRALLVSYDSRPTLRTPVPKSQQPWRRGQKMTLAHIARAINEGCGSGHDERYKPWIRVRRRLSSPVSNLYVECLPLYRRGLHLLSRLELDAAQLACWLGARSIREQFPMWPWAHPHPGASQTPDASGRIVKVSGLLEIAQRAGIAHGVYPGTDIPFVGTIDLLCEVPSGTGTRLVGIACKPKSKMEGKGSERVNERLKLEFLYCESIGAFSSVFTDGMLSDRFCGNLDWFTPKFGEFTRFCGLRNRLEHFAGAFNQDVGWAPIFHCKVRGGAQVGLSDHSQIDAYFKMAAYRGLIDIDFREPIIMSKPLRRDTGHYKKKLYERFFGAPR